MGDNTVSRKKLDAAIAEIKRMKEKHHVQALGDSDNPMTLKSKGAYWFAEDVLKILEAL